MPLFLNTTGNSVLGIGLCARCSRKFPLLELEPDRNSPGLMVCRDDNDEFDPYRLPAHQGETITLMFVRPDVPLDEFVDEEEGGNQGTFFAEGFFADDFFATDFFT